MEYPIGDHCLLYRFPISTGNVHDMKLFLIKEGEPLPAEILRQAVEVVQLAVSIWSRQHDEIVVTELVRAILQDEPMKMRRLADIFNIDVKSINAMWILKPAEQTAAQIDEIIRICRDVLTGRCKTLVIDEYEDSVVVFMDGQKTLQDQEFLVNELHRCVAAAGIAVTITECGNLMDTGDVRSAFLNNADYLTDAGKIFPGRAVYSLQEVKFAGDCRKLVEQGEQTVKETLFILSFLDDGEDTELRRTLAVYLLDAGWSVSKAAKLLHIHKNTVKYRLQRMGDRLGFRIGDMPETMKIYEAAALERLLS